MSALGSSYLGNASKFNNSKIFISKCNYNKSDIDVSAAAHQSQSNVTYHFKITVSGNKIVVDYNNGEKVISYVDDLGFTHGSIGLYTDGAAAIYKNIKIYK